VQKVKIQTQNIFCITRVRFFSSSAQVYFYNTAVNLHTILAERQKGKL